MPNDQLPKFQAISASLRKWIARGVVLGLVVGILILIVSRLYSLTFLFGLIFGYDEQKAFFYQTLGFSDAWSTVLGRLMQFITALAWIPLIYYFPLNPLRAKKLAIFFVGFTAIYIANPLIKALVHTDVCFNQKTGTPIKWYVVEYNGQVTLYDSDGFDQNGVRKRPASTEVCQIYQNQKHGFVPHQLDGDPRSLTFFYANGAAKVWYDQGSDGQYRFFDAPGYDPNTGARLLPVTPQVRDQAVKNVEKAEADRRQQEEQARLKAQDEARKAEADRAEQDKREHARLEVEHRRAEAEHKRQAAAQERAKAAAKIHPELDAKHEKCLTLATGERVCSGD